MSVNLQIYVPWNARENNGTFRLKDMLIPDQEYELFSQIVNMSIRREENPKILEKPTVNTIEMTQAQTVIDVSGNSHVPDQNFYFCRAGEFKKLPPIETTYHNNAIIAFLQALDPDSFVVIKVSW